MCSIYLWCSHLKWSQRRLLFIFAYQEIHSNGTSLKMFKRNELHKWCCINSKGKKAFLFSSRICLWCRVIKNDAFMWINNFESRSVRNSTYNCWPVATWFRCNVSDDALDPLKCIQYQAVFSHLKKTPQQ